MCHGKRGTLHQAYRGGMEDQPGVLGLVLNAPVLWTAKYIGAAVARLSPLKHRNPNPNLLRLRPSPGCQGRGVRGRPAGVRG
ncbi:Tn3 family transposase [Streptomyces roseolus]|uniref:Tn3 family transposase n=1 Tax=Streptomyces roseolus TaxID=67358 RepID=UPI0033D0B828